MDQFEMHRTKTFCPTKTNSNGQQCSFSSKLKKQMFIAKNVYIQGRCFDLNQNTQQMKGSFQMETVCFGKFTPVVILKKQNLVPSLFSSQ